MACTFTDRGDGTAEEPLPPVLASVVLDELDWEPDRRGHRFARYADDCNILVKSKVSGWASG